MGDKKSLISLFAGAGGLDLGLEMAGFKTIVANELETHACETLEKNKELCNLNSFEVDDFIEKVIQQKCFNSLSEKEKKLFFDRLKRNQHQTKFLQDATIIQGDIRTIESSVFKKHIKGNELFCIAGGPPCQPFSKAGKQKSLDCTKNGDLFSEFVRLVDDLRPKWFLFENVKGITFTKTDVIYQSCKNCHAINIAPFKIRQDFETFQNDRKCENCGSQNTDWLTENEPGGSLKIIFNEFQKLGYKCTYKVLNAADFGAPQIRERLIIVGNRDGKNFDWPIPTHSKSINGFSQGDLFQKISPLKKWVTLKEKIWAQGHNYYGEIDESQAKLWVKNVVRPHDEPVTWNLDRPSPTIGAHQGAKLAFAPFGIPEKQLFRQQWATKGRKQGDTPPVPVEHRYLSDEELLKLQTFPDWWYLHGTRMQRAFQIGNAVPPILGKVIGDAIIKSENTL
ncbi:MAG: DNA cytosine methyltransferase [Saprospiraceae bacterium]|nr:DNA cytosine methyltransferase [Saprospiraceae bacterium]MCF8280808.1 DNA cytosine methyltransferase [Bacteroidales bacterium]MCF8312522.1 DNA cytosine methyltransferase [Saprospiraceae bacterium]MCF8440798.1 DNA cytosine methyltransferase [Saprospiraceae bacterium]